MKKTWVAGIVVLCIVICLIFVPMFFRVATISPGRRDHPDALVVHVHPNHIATVWYANGGYGIDPLGEPVEGRMELRKIMYIPAEDYKEIQAYIEELKEIEQQSYPPYNYLRNVLGFGYTYVEVDNAYWWSPDLPRGRNYFTIDTVDELSYIIVENLDRNHFFD